MGGGGGCEKRKKKRKKSSVAAAVVVGKVDIEGETAIDAGSGCVRVFQNRAVELRGIGKQGGRG